MDDVVFLQSLFCIFQKTNVMTYVKVGKCYAFSVLQSKLERQLPMLK